MKFIVSKGLEHFSGGLLGRLVLAQLVGEVFCGHISQEGKKVGGK